MGAWIEMALYQKMSWWYNVAPHDGCVDWNRPTHQARFLFGSRTPRWVRGLKFLLFPKVLRSFLSHPTMGAWIEIYMLDIVQYLSISRTPRWVRGLKFWIRWRRRKSKRRTPRWVRGLKYVTVLLFQLLVKSHPTMGAWIEIKSVKVIMLSNASRTPRRVRGLKWDLLFRNKLSNRCRTPRWVRGLKL